MILLDNTVHFTPDQGRVVVGTVRNGRHCMLTVVDDGPGIAPGALPHVFDRFFRADAARRRGGAGLGLAIARWIVETHGGRIELFSVVGGWVDRTRMAASRVIFLKGARS